ncbi:MAG TPA: carbamoyltransferase C-terminal domain-containing protein [Prolixibacteraceae bacterium]|mgnify:CR=1 FL=1|nr:carbamoyltransferase C-terminal domain-containing protein [Prolixibacteraceae bacterium]
MDSSKPTLGIYGIQDRVNTMYPQYAHDHSLALMNNGKVEHYLQLERHSGIKRDNKLHEHLPLLVKEAGWVESNFDVVFVDNVVGRAFISASGQIRFETPISKRLTKSWEESRLWWFNREIDGYVLNHELAHVFSCIPFYGEFKENSLLIHFDGGASLSNFSAWMYRMGKIIPVEHHWELKHLTALYNANALTFGIIGANIEQQNSVPGKLMGYAALGNYNEDIEFWLRKNDWFADIWGKRSAFMERAKIDFQIDLKSFDQHNTFLQDVVATIQEVFMRETLMKIDDVNTLSNCSNLYYTGGCALNIQTNSALVESKLFENIYIPPCTDDSGLSLGAAAFGEWMKGNRFPVHPPFLNNWQIESPDFDFTPNDVAQVAQMLAQGKIIGVCNGFGEAGPRALGNRSIIALPTKALSKKVSVDIKQREWYRPVAPIMLEKNTKYFTGLSSINHLSKFMLIDFDILPEKQAEIPGVVHANGTSRIQTLFSRNENPFMFDLLTLLDTNYNVKALINTSFNIQGKPIAHTNNDALNYGKQMELDAVVINGKTTVL